MIQSHFTIFLIRPKRIYKRTKIDSSQLKSCSYSTNLRKHDSYLWVQINFHETYKDKEKEFDSCMGDIICS